MFNATVKAVYKEMKGMCNQNSSNLEQSENLIRTLEEADKELSVAREQMEADWRYNQQRIEQRMRNLYGKRKRQEDNVDEHE